MEHGAVSEACARAMAEGALERSSTSLSASVTGIAGPGGASADKPVGLVHIACARRGFETRHERHLFSGDRERVRLQAVESTLRLLNQMAAADA
jgi:nicotinamide-nucleotide amidase